ncbi:MAG: helix-turn-helix domain-containing protein [Nocardioides sp.]
MIFNPTMLTTVRDAAGLTQSAIAEYAGLSQATVSKIENGLEEPTSAFVLSVSELAAVPPDLFYQWDELLPGTLFDIFHKKRLTLPAKPLKAANARAQLTRLQVGHLLRTFDVPVSLPFPNLNLGQHESPAEVAALARAMWRVPNGPLPNLVKVVEATGTPVILMDLGHEKLRAMSMPGAKSYGTHIILLNERLPASAQRFALAHEVGHLVMHEGVANNEMEKEADDFASALLMPEEDITPKLRNVRFRDLGALKALWRVSLAALIFRAHDLGLVSDRHYRTLFMELNKLPNGRKREPGEFPVEEPKLVRNVIANYVTQGYSIGELCRMMVVTEGDFKVRYLGEAPPEGRLRLLKGAAG